MKYDELLEIIKNNFKNKIQVQDKMLRMKIFNNLFNWYERNFAENLKQAVEENNELKIINLLKEIELVCSLNDYQKMKLVYVDEAFEELKNVSINIFEGVKKFIETNQIVYNPQEINKIVEKIDTLEQNVSDLLKEEFMFEKSECLLDIEYLMKKGKVNNFSIRTNQLIKSYE